MKNSILIASLFAVALAACGKKEEAPLEPTTPAVTEPAPAPVEPTTTPVTPEPAAPSGSSAMEPATPAEPAPATPAPEEKK